MGMSDVIAGFINQVLSERSGTAELSRSELAGMFNCVPSQINYVISTRFSPEHGYVVESRRGGGGYIRITRVEMESKMLLMHTVNSIGQTIDFPSLSALIANLLQGGVISKEQARLMLAAVSDRALVTVEKKYRDIVRAGILKQMLINIV